jgi:MOSC domain-containing protein YiiM
VRVEKIYISPGHNFFGRKGLGPDNHPLLDVAEVRCVAGHGLEGDRFFNYKEDYNGQVTFFEIETWERLCTQTGVTDRSPGVFRRNIITRGVDLNTLVGREFEVQGVKFLATQPSTPCEWMNVAFAPGAEQMLAGKGGIRAKILTDGILKAGA